MIKRKRKILILGSIIIALTAILGVYIFLAATGVVHASVNDLVIKSADISREYNGKLLTNGEEKYTIVSGNLHDGHKIITNYYSQIKEAGQVPNEMTVEILDANNQDVSKEYNLTVNFGYLTVNKRSIKIETASDSKPYDGTPLSKDSYEITKGSIVLGEEEEIRCYSEITEIGSIKNECSVSIVKLETNEDVTKNYDIDVEYGTLEIGQREMTVSSESKSLEYDGTSFTSTAADFSITKGEFINPTHQIKYIPEIDDITNAGDYTYKFSCQIFDEEGRDVSSSYHLSYDYGTIKINKRGITITAVDKAKNYDAKPIYDVDNKELSLKLDYTLSKNVVDGDELIVYSSLSGESLKNTVNVSTYNIDTQYELSTNNKDNYDIKTVPGKYIVNQAPVTITSKNSTKLYNGKTYYEVEGWQLSESEYTIDGDIFDATIKVYNDMTSDELSDTRNVGIHSLKIKAEIYENDEPSSNFKIKCEAGELNVSKYQITVTLANQTKTYDRQPLYADDNHLLTENDYKKTDLLDNTTIEVYSKLQGDELAKTKNVTSSFDLDAECKVFENGTDITENFAINVVKGKLVVNKRSLFISTTPKTKEYDGNVYDRFSQGRKLDEDKDYKISTKQLEGTDVLVKSDLTADELEKTKNVGEYSLKAKALVLYLDTDESDNYNIVINPGNLIVSKKKITISAMSKTQIYDGKPYDFSSPKEKVDYLLSDKLVNDDVITVKGSVENSKKDVGMYKLKLSVEESSITNNYDFNCVDGILTILPKTVYVRTKNVSKEYDGGQYYTSTIPSEDYEYEIVDGDDVSIELTSTSNDYLPGIYDNDATCNAGGKDHDNYKFVISAGKIEITKLDVKINIKQQLEYYEGDIILEHDDLLDKEKYSVESDNKDIKVALKYKGEDINYIGQYTFDKDNLVASINLNDNDISQYCNINISYNSIIVKTKAMLTVNSVSKEYDGNCYIEAGAELKPNDYKFDELLNDDKLSITYAGEENIEAGDYSFEVKAIITSLSGEDVTNFYEITYKFGTITIRYAIEVTFNNVAKTYDGQVFYEKGHIFDKDEYNVNNEALTYSLIYNGEAYKNVGAYDIKLALKVFKGEQDITDRCDISYVNAAGVTPIMTIMKRDITIRTGSASKSDDGTPLLCKKILIDGKYEEILSDNIIPTQIGDLVDGDKLLAIEWTKLEAVGQCANFVLCAVYDSNGNDVSRNYDIAVTTGLLEIHELLSDRNEIKISPVKQSIKWQSGLNASNVFDPNGKVIGISEFENAGMEVSYSLILSGDDTEAGKYKISIDQSTFRITLNGTDVTKTYLDKIIFEDDYLYWYLYDITVRTETKIDNIYEGPLSGGDVSLASGNLAPGHKIITTEQCISSSIGMVINRPKYKIVDEDDHDVTDLYNIKESFGKLQITNAKEITIEFNLNEGLSSKQLEKDEYTVSTLASGDRITITLKDNVTREDLQYSDTYEELIDIKILNDKNEDVTNCYSIDYSN